MAARSIWKGHLRLSLVTIPIRVYSATNAAAEIHFNQLHRECQTRIQYKKWCPHCEREVPSDEIVKGYEFEREKHLKDLSPRRTQRARRVRGKCFPPTSSRPSCPSW
jgi:Ku protein